MSSKLTFIGRSGPGGRARGGAGALGGRAGAFGAGRGLGAGGYIISSVKGSMTVLSSV